MKKILSLLLMLALLALTACGKSEYPPVESTDKESEVLYTMTIGDSEYEVKYELYRAFFLTYKSQIDGGNSNAWTSADAGEYVSRINSVILPKIADIYSTIYIAEQTGFDFDSDEVEERIDEFIRESIEGGTHDSMIIEGYGSYEAYLTALKELKLNYSVQILLYKYAIAQDVIDEYYIGTFSEDNFTPDSVIGKLEFTEDDVRAFYNSDDCALIYEGFVQQMFGETRANEWREDIIEKVGDGVSVAVAMIGKNILANETPTPIGKNSLDVTYYSDLTDAVFALEVGEFSEVIKVNTGYENGFYILYREEKTDSYLEENYANVVSVYLDNEIGKMISDAKDTLMESISYTDAYGKLSHGEIDMD